MRLPPYHTEVVLAHANLASTSIARDGARVVGRPEWLAVRPDLEPVWHAADAAFPVRVTRSFAQRIDPSNPRDPLALQVLPDPRELIEDQEDLDDPVGDAAMSPVPWVVRKHADRVLLLLTKRCHLYCRYCFRRNHRPGEAEDPTADELETALRYIEAAAPEEVILSGGDPLAVRDQRLFSVIDRVRAVSPVVRIHTRAPVTEPSRVTDALVRGLRERAPIWLIIHCNHVNELSTSVDEALARLVDAGVPVLNQAVLLRGVNDDADTLADLSQSLVRRRVFPYYLHHTDHARGNAYLRVSRERGAELYRQLQQRVSGISLPRYVVDPPSGTGKVDAAPLDRVERPPAR